LKGPFEGLARDIESNIAFLYESERVHKKREQLAAMPLRPYCRLVGSWPENGLRGDNSGFSEGDFQPWNISGQAVTRKELNSTNATESRFPNGTIRAAVGFGFQDHCTALIAGYRAIQIPEIFVSQSRKAQTL